MCIYICTYVWGNSTWVAWREGSGRDGAENRLKSLAFLLAGREFTKRKRKEKKGFKEEFWELRNACINIREIRAYTNRWYWMISRY